MCTEGGQLGWERDALDLLSTTAFPQAVVQRLGGVLAGQQGQRNPPDGVELQCCLYNRVNPPPHNHQWVQATRRKIDPPETAYQSH